MNMGHIGKKYHQQNHFYFTKVSQNVSKSAPWLQGYENCGKNMLNLIQYQLIKKQWHISKRVIYQINYIFYITHLDIQYCAIRFIRRQQASGFDFH